MFYCSSIVHQLCICELTVRRLYHVLHTVGPYTVAEPIRRSNLYLKPNSYEYNRVFWQTQSVGLVGYWLQDVDGDRADNLNHAGAAKAAASTVGGAASTAKERLEQARVKAKTQLQEQRQHAEEQGRQAEAREEEQCQQAEAREQKLTTLFQEQRRQAEAREEKLIQVLTKRATSTDAHFSIASGSIPKFALFDASVELWKDSLAQLTMFVGANSIPAEKRAQVFLTSQSTTTYKLLGTVARQQDPPKDINELSMENINSFMEQQYNSKCFVVWGRFRFWSNMQRTPGETAQELSARIRQEAATCDFASRRDAQDEALHTKCICSIGNEAVLKALFKVKDNDLTFSRAV